MKYISKEEFNLRFLWELQCYPPKVARDLFRECGEDIRFQGWWYAQRRRAKFIGLDKEEDNCSVSGSSDWWYRPASELSGSGEWLRCHPKPVRESSRVRVEEGS